MTRPPNCTPLLAIASCVLVEVSTNPSLPCAYVGAGILTRTKRSVGLTSPEGSALASESVCASLLTRTRQGREATCVAAKGRRGVSAWKLARTLRRRLMFGPLHDRRRGADRPLAFSVTLTCRSGNESEIRAKLADFVRVVGARAPKVGLLCALDRAPSGAWHAHALALLPPSLDPEKLKVWWCRCWANRNVRPVRGAQHVRPLALGGASLANDLDRVLAHHLGRTRKIDGQRVPVLGLPSLPDRVVACGGLAGVWARVCTAKRIPVAPYVAPARKRRSRATKVSTVASRPMQTWFVGVSCAWCAKIFANGKRRGSRYCGGRSCGSAASRALRAFEGRVGAAMAPAARTRVLALEAKGWLRPDAIHAVYAATMIATEKARPLAEVKVRAPACRCGRAIAPRANAVTCGDAACRMKLLRRRRSQERRRVRIRALFSVLLRRRRWRFTDDEARMMGADLRVRARDVNELLRQLVQEDGTAFVLFGAPGVYSFVPPHAPSLAA